MAKELCFTKIPKEYTIHPLKSNEDHADQCYYLPDSNQIFKYFGDRSEYIWLYDFFASIKSKSFVFPETLVYQVDDKKRLIGYLMPFIEGTTLKYLNRDVSIDKLSKAFETVVDDILTDITYNQIDLCDVNTQNVIYTPEEELKIIDTDLYDYTNIDEPMLLHPGNMQEFNNDMIPFVFKSSSFLEFKNDSLGKELDRIRRFTSYGSLPINEVLLELKRVLETALDKEHKTMQDIDNSLALIRKKV